MAEVEVTDSMLIVHVVGVDKILALKSRLEVPLSQVKGSAPLDEQTQRDLRHSLRLPGTYLPGVIIAGSYYEWSNHQWMFWDVERPEQAIVITLAHERFTRLVIEVADPQATIQAIQTAIGAQKEPRSSV